MRLQNLFCKVILIKTERIKFKQYFWENWLFIKFLKIEFNFLKKVKLPTRLISDEKINLEIPMKDKRKEEVENK